ncbi:MAG: flavin reductase family protein [Gammaproteobacteria bacterium]
MVLHAECLSLDDLDPAQFKSVLRRFTSSVCIVTAGQGTRYTGMTATAVCSVSADPPSMLVVINQANRSHGLVESAGAFAINLLSSEQRSLAVHFSSRPADPFSGVDYRLGSVNAPIIRDCAAYLECVVDSQVKSGTHSIFIGRVVSLDAAEKWPLCYRNGEFLVSGGVAL